MFHELRTYWPVPGRHGELMAHTKENIVPLYQKYGFKPQGLGSWRSAPKSATWSSSGNGRI